MEKPSKKLKKTILILGVTGAVYLCFKYLLPLVIPFILAYVFALALRPSALWLEKRLSLDIGGKQFHIPLAVIGGIEIFLILLILTIAAYFGIRRLVAEANQLANNLPAMIRRLDMWLTGNCYWVEHTFHLQRGSMVVLAREMLMNMGKAAKETAMPFLMTNSMTIFRCLVETIVITVILFIATILSLQEMENIRDRRDRSQFCREYAILGNRLMSVGSAYLKTQGSIVIITTVICVAGLFFLKNPYYILLGIGIGLLDALPIFGTGTVFIPWAIFSAFRGDWLYAGVLLIIYLVCYFLREYMEAKVMGDKVGLSPLETLISMYVGLQLFGILGFILGPIGLLIIEDIVEFYYTSTG